ncbi:alpha/beta hydrolase [Comamonadaceae bacterium OH2545_COT-014]|nr:alpha/beta hydrolase [Comamonadaceae bacterium OH2545_COT-014]
MSEPPAGIAVPALLPLAVRLRLAQAVRLTTPCGTGYLVWHAWGERRPETAPLVLLHGGSGSWTHWVHNILPLVDAGRWVLAADLPGFGESALPPAGSHAGAMTAPLADGLRQLLGGLPCDLVGFSFGALTAGLLLAGQPDLARRLVLVGAPGMGVAPGRQVRLQAWRHLPSAAAQRQAHRHNLAALMLHDPARLDALALQIHIANVQRDRLPRRRLSHADLLARHLGAVSCPVHAIYGTHDAVYGPHIHRLPAAFAAAAPCFAGLQWIEGAGHWVQYEAPAAFHAALMAALSA